MHGKAACEQQRYVQKDCHPPHTGSAQWIEGDTAGEGNRGTRARYKLAALEPKPVMRRPPSPMCWCAFKIDARRSAITRAPVFVIACDGMRQTPDETAGTCRQFDLERKLCSAESTCSTHGALNSHRGAATRGFTLVELLVVVALIAISAGVVVPLSASMVTSGEGRQHQPRDRVLARTRAPARDHRAPQLHGGVRHRHEQHHDRPGRGPRVRRPRS